MNFEADKVKGLLNLMSMPLNSTKNNIKLEFNKRYLARVNDVKLGKNEFGYPVITVIFDVRLDNNITGNITVKYSLSETTRYKKLNELKTLITALSISAETLCKNSKTDEDIILNTVVAIRENINKNIILVKEGKQSYYSYRAYPYEGSMKNEQ